MLHFKSYPQDKQPDQNSTIYHKENEYPCLGYDLSFCVFIISCITNSADFQGCFVLDQCCCFELRLCCKLGENRESYPCGCATNGNGYICKISGVCAEIGFGCCFDNICLFKHQFCCLNQEILVCPSITSDSTSFMTLCCYSIWPKSGFCLNFQELFKKDSEENASTNNDKI